MTNLDSILSSRDITLPTKVCIVKAMVSTVVTHGCESWTTTKEIGSDQFLLQKADRQRIEAFKLWYWGRLLRVPWTARRSNQSILNILISWRKPTLNIHWKDWRWSWSYNTLATWCEQMTHWRRPSCWERLKAGGEGDNRGWDGRMESLTQWTWGSANSRRWWRTGKPGMLHSMGLQSQTWLSNWTITKKKRGGNFSLPNVIHVNRISTLFFYKIIFEIVMLKIFQAGFNSMWSMKFQMFKLVLEKAEEPEIKLPTSIRSLKKQESSREKHLLLLYWLHQSLCLCGSQQTVENS